MPAYNHEKYIKDCIYSIVNQTYKYKELIIIDDCSKDNTAQIINQVLSDKNIINKFNGRIKFVINSENKGAHYTINKGIELAKGNYITIINTDDMFESNRLEIMMNLIKSSGTQLCFSKVKTIDENNNIFKNKHSKYFYEIQESIYKYPFINIALIPENIAISTGNMVFSKNLYNQLGGFKNYKYIHDWDFILRATLICEPKFTDKTNYLYRIHSTNSFKELKEDIELCQRETKEVLSNYFNSIKSKNYKNIMICKDNTYKHFLKNIINNSYIYEIWENS